MDLTRMRPDTFHEAIRRIPPELPFEALDHKTKKSIRTSRSRGLIKPSYPPLPHHTDPTGEVRRRRERNTILGPRILIAVLMVVTALIGVAVLLRLFVE
ncbi:hypothetical protein [Arthrobacter sp. YN]|uniref:hypothetical protein n=1 Tax=Arthrobacter sp. YN TaxID=2020486 RepID=UPI0012FD2581|nr:hypothetical protein [Arthrobacter sp. YN]